MALIDIGPRVVEKQPRKRGKYANKSKKWTQIALGMMAIGSLAIIGGGLVLENFKPTELVYAAEVATSTPTIKEEFKGKSIEQLKDEFIHELASKENLNGLPAYLDDNSHGTLPKKDKLSYGCLSYKLSTIERHYKAVNGKEINDLDAALLALNCPKAKDLAKSAIFGAPNAINEWMAATDKMKMKVSIIRDMDGI